MLCLAWRSVRHGGLAVRRRRRPFGGCGAKGHCGACERVRQGGREGRGPVALWPLNVARRGGRHTGRMPVPPNAVNYAATL